MPDSIQQDMIQRSEQEEKICNDDLRGKNLKGKNFSNADLTGANLTEANLTGANLTEANLTGANLTESDIRGTKFNKAILKGANFSKAKAGVQLQWRSIQFLLAFFVTLLTGSLSGLNSSFIFYFFQPVFIKEYTIIPGITLLLMFITVVIIIVLMGFNFEAFIIISIAGALAFCIAGTVAFAVAGVVAAFVAVAIAGSIAVAFSFTIGGAFNVAFSFIVASFTAVILNVLINSFLASVLFSPNFIFKIINTSFKFNITFNNVFASIFAITSNLLGVYAMYRSWNENEKFSLILTISKSFGAIGGTDFENADLTDANFTEANLKYSSFLKADLTRVLWLSAKGLKFVKIDINSILANPNVRKLLINLDGRNKSFLKANMRGANLNGVVLEQSDLTQSDLSGATLREANLKSANLTQVMAVNTDFTEANLTGACLESWNIDRKTKLDDVICKFVYLKNNKKDRSPSSGEFSGDDFTKLYDKALNTVDLIFRDGFNWDIFANIFKEVQVKNKETELSIQSIEKKGEIVIIKVSVPENANKEKIHNDFNIITDLINKVHTTHNQRVLDLKEFIYLLSDKIDNKLNIQVDTKLENNVVSNNDSSRITNITGETINATGAGALSSGDIIGTVANTINQLPSSSESDKHGIKELLNQLKTAIESESNLSNEDKVDALQHIQTLAEAGQKPNDGSVHKTVKITIQALKGIFSSLPDVAKLAEASKTLIPLISHIFGF